jgi:hypothetical protein
MIKDSAKWRAELTGVAKFLEEKTYQLRWSDITFFQTERNIMTAFYWIRKMLESKKSSPKIMASSLKLLEFERGLIGSGKVVGPILQVNFDMEHPKAITRDLVFVCHQIVHSYIFSLAVGYQSGLQGVYFSSDREHRSRLFFISVEDLINAIKMVGLDTDVGFSPWIEERLQFHRVQTAFPQP